MREKFDGIFDFLQSCTGQEAWENLLAFCPAEIELEEFPAFLEKHAAVFGLPDYLPDLARLKLAVREIGSSLAECECPITRLTVNPTLRLEKFSWKRLPDLLTSRDESPAFNIEKGAESVLLWRRLSDGEVVVRAAAAEDFLVLKIVIEEIEPAKAASEGGVPVKAIEAAIDRGIEKGMVLAPVSKIRRNCFIFPRHAEIDENDLAASVFTLQWHITQACDLHCRHCYDRSDAVPVDLRQAMNILDDFHGFCREHYVKGHISFTGGNPFLHSDFPAIYRAASEHGFSLAILGNPVPAGLLKKLTDIRLPGYYQISMEGLREYNDWVRGPGHFDRSLDFLDLLRECNIYSMVMLTLTKHNIDHVLLLAEVLNGRADLFTFNRLSLTGEGANLELPSREEYISFLRAYSDAAVENPLLGLKDNLINLVRYSEGSELFGGCTGFGCGAAFNFIAVLPNGDAHACRKFQSHIGNIIRDGIAKVYSSESARSYRAGSSACRSCAIRHACGGCLAVTHSLGLNPLKARDPYCFVDETAAALMDSRRESPDLLP